jgi:predicted nucleotidyltransferase component of viral defense system
MTIKFDPNKKEPISHEMQLEISEIMQNMVLEKIFSSKNWDTKNLIFHGGTSVHVAWSSPRYSEDLDFLLNIEQVDNINTTIQNSIKEIEKELQQKFPGSEITLKTKGNNEKIRSVIVYDIIWKHPNKYGKVRVKTEFFTVPPSNIKAYESINKEWKNNDMLIWTKPQIEVDNLKLNVATPKSIYGDKIKCIATREYLKPRDFFDLWWLKTQLSQYIPNNETEIYKTIRHSADCYETKNLDLINGFERILHLNREDTIELIKENLKNFIPEDTYLQMLKNDSFSEIFDNLQNEIKKCSDIVKNNDPNWKLDKTQEYK